MSNHRFFVCFVGSLGLGYINRTESDDYSDIDCDCMVEKSPNDLLDKADNLWQKRGGFVKIFVFGVIDGLRPSVGGILSAFGVGMLELVQCFIYVSWHGDVDSLVGVIPREIEAAEKRSRPVDGDGAQAAECGNEMVRGVVAGVIDAEIIDNQRKHNEQVGVCHKQPRTGDGGIDVFGEMQSEVIFGNDAGLIEAGHAFSDFEVDPFV